MLAVVQSHRGLCCLLLGMSVLGCAGQDRLSQAPATISDVIGSLDSVSLNDLSVETDTFARVDGTAAEVDAELAPSDVPVVDTTHTDAVQDSSNPTIVDSGSDSPDATDPGLADSGSPSQDSVSMDSDALDALGSTPDSSGSDVTGSCLKATDCPPGSTACLVAICEANQCALAAAATATTCDDGDLCTQGDSCGAGVCIPGAATLCDDGNPCTTDSCQPNLGCAASHDDQASCSDANPCTVQTCKAGLCVVTLSQATCDDGDTCTTKDVCVAGLCKGELDSCDDGNTCTDDACGAKGCTHQANSTLCNDGDLCTGQDLCVKSACVAGLKVQCDDGNKCTGDSCQPKTGVCIHTAIQGCVSCKAKLQGGRLVHGSAPPLVKVDPLCKKLSYGLYPGQGQVKAAHLLPDFSFAGYMGGGVAIPTIAVKKTLKPVAGDDKKQIQSAIDQLSALPPDAQGYRGAILLTKGTYQISDTLVIAASGIVLRGVGQGTSGTIVVATKKAQHDLIHFKGKGSGWSQIKGTQTKITSAMVPVGGRTLTLSDASSLKVGMTIAVRRTPNQAWIDLLGMGKYGWTPQQYAVNHERTIVAIEGKVVTVDIPLVDAIESQYGGGEVFGVDFSGRIQRSGLEDVRLVSEYASPTDEAHGWNAIKLSRVENCWVRRVTAQHFGYSAVTIEKESAFNTIEEVAQLDPKSQVTGGRRYSFNISDGVGNLFQRCFARQGRHNFVTGSRVTGPNVWLDSLSVQNNSDEGPHHRWATGALFDACMSKFFHVQNRKTSGTGHGWAGAQTLFWNVLATSELRCDAPKTAMNWSVGSIGTKSQGIWAPEEPFGLFESHAKPVEIRSLYLAQLADRLGQAAVSAVTIAEQSGWIWNRLNAWAGKEPLSKTISNTPSGCKGLVAGTVCCANSCGVCGGTGCSARPGGVTSCCSGSIKQANKSCSNNAPPCVLP